MEELVNEIREMRKEINDLRESSRKMDRHIDFIERIYGNLKSKIFYFLDNTIYSVNKCTPELQTGSG